MTWERKRPAVIVEWTALDATLPADFRELVARIADAEAVIRPYNPRLLALTPGTRLGVHQITAPIARAAWARCTAGSGTVSP
jgi:hypothetical protein